MGKQIKEQNRFKKIINMITYALKIGVNVCSMYLFPVIKHISCGVYVYELTSMCDY